MTHFLDTNSFRILESYYPKRFPSFWQRFNHAAENRVIASVAEVRKEIERGTAAPHILEWVKDNPDFFGAPTEDELEAVSEIFEVAHFQGMVGTKPLLHGTPVADPFLVAAAMVAPGSVITEERYRPNSAKIPTVCEHFSVPCTTLEGMLTSLEWSF
jgi:hypothetical protein